MNINMTNNKAGFYLSFVSVILGGLVLFFMDWWKKKGHSHSHRKPYPDIRDSGKFVKEGASSVVGKEVGHTPVYKTRRVRILQ